MSFYKYQSARGGEKEKKILFFVCMVYYRLRVVVWCVVVVFFLVSLKRKNTPASSFHRCFTILRSHKCGIIYTRFHTFIWWRKAGMLIFFKIPVVR